MSESVIARLSAALAGRYRIERELGQGGMATVFLAHDLRHDRDVAIKVLHPDLGAALGGERFLSEIKTTAKLQHPHILPLLDSGDADGLLYYVMPVVTGETLRAHLDRAHQLPIAEAVRIAREVASALDYAHRQNIIHRDIKPENILLHDGSALVADFGIALAVQSAGGQRMTQTGLSLGTPQYMSPEQAMGEKTIDARADVYALGAMTYEMLTGDAPFTGTTVQAIVAKVLSADPERPTLVRKTIPPNVESAVLTALAKLPADRFASAAEFAAALGNTGYTSATSAATSAVDAVSSRTLRVVSAAALLAVAAAAWGWLRPQPGAPVVRYDLPLPSVMTGIAEVHLPLPSPDGSFLVFPGPRPGSVAGTQLWLKRRDRFSPTPIDGTTDSQGFTISPDGQWLAFIRGSKLAKVPIAGGASITLARGMANGAWGIAWLDDGTIAYTPLADHAGLAKVSANGGESAIVWEGDARESRILGPIHGTRGVLFALCSTAATCDLWAVDVATGKAHVVLPGVSWARHAATGQIVYTVDGRLMAVAFDAGAMTVRGQPVALTDSVGRGASPFELSRSGTLVTRVFEGAAGLPYDMVWVDRAGRVTPVDTSWHFGITAYAADHGWRLSPDGTRLAIGLLTDAGDDIWVKQLPHGSLSRVSFDPAAEARPRWTHDGRALTFLTGRGGLGIVKRRADGLGADSSLISGQVDESVYSPDGQWIVIRTGSNGSVSGGRDIYGIRTGKDTTRVPLVVTPFDEEAVELSPDGKWLAYQSDETGRTEIFVRSFPNTKDFKLQLSNGGGEAPLWSHDGRELFFVNADKMMMSVRLTPGATLAASAPVALFRVPDDLLQVEYAFYTPWDVASDGRFIMARARRQTGTAMTVGVTENWFAELKARVRQ